MLDNDPQLAYILLVAFWLTFFALIGLRWLTTRRSAWREDRIVRRRLNALKDYKPHPRYWTTTSSVDDSRPRPQVR